MLQRVKSDFAGQIFYGYWAKRCKKLRALCISLSLFVSKRYGATPVIRRSCFRGSRKLGSNGRKPGHKMFRDQSFVQEKAKFVKKLKTYGCLVELVSFLSMGEKGIQRKIKQNRNSNPWACALCLLYCRAGLWRIYKLVPVFWMSCVYETRVRDSPCLNRFFSCHFNL